MNKRLIKDGSKPSEVLRLIFGSSISLLMFAHSDAGRRKGSKFAIAKITEMNTKPKNKHEVPIGANKSIDRNESNE